MIEKLIDSLIETLILILKVTAFIAGLGVIAYTFSTHNYVMAVILSFLAIWFFMYTLE